MKHVESLPPSAHRHMYKQYREMYDIEVGEGIVVGEVLPFFAA